MLSKRRIAPAAYTGIGLALGIALWGLGLQIGSAQPASPEGIGGPALAERLGLELQDGFAAVCEHYVTRDIDASAAGWCIDEVVDTDYEAWELAHRLLGDPPTELARQIFALEMEFSQLTDKSSADAREIALQLDELLALEESTER